MPNSPFPDGCDNLWLSAEDSQLAALPVTLKEWLLDSGSLTARLREQYQDVRIALLRQETAAISPGEQQLFDADKHSFEIREILFICDGQPRVFARTLLPESTLELTQANFRQLGNRPLGEVLFQTSGMERGAIQVSSFDADSSIGHFSKQLGYPIRQPLWGRRSLFYLQQQPLLVTEIFLPAAAPYQDTSTE